MPVSTPRIAASIAVTVGIAAVITIGEQEQQPSTHPQGADAPAVVDGGPPGPRPAPGHRREYDAFHHFR